MRLRFSAIRNTKIKTTGLIFLSLAAPEGILTESIHPPVLICSFFLWLKTISVVLAVSQENLVGLIYSLHLLVMFFQVFPPGSIRMPALTFFTIGLLYFRKGGEGWETKNFPGISYLFDGWFSIVHGYIRAAAGHLASSAKILSAIFSKAFAAAL